jgi:hypothetical protein
MTTITKTPGDADRAPGTADKVRMTEAMREGLDALQREYSAFVETSFETLALITDQRSRRADS